MTTSIRVFNVKSLSLSGPVRHERLNMTTQEKTDGLSDHFFSCTLLVVDNDGQTIELNLITDKRESLNLERL